MKPRGMDNASTGRTTPRNTLPTENPRIDSRTASTTDRTASILPTDVSSPVSVNGDGRLGMPGR